MNSMKIAAVWGLAKMAYSTILRGILLKAVEDPNTEWDDWLLGLCDKIFEYQAS